ncbi:SPT3 Dosage dependent suppressor of Ty-induced promoter mutations-like protein [Gryganskiella cystojenkinii]|nr:SPT3 Dosage dependent suppressor of Ty-induced promoter mutations-like protein [Gryganskiella cystojenkinii]
MPPYSATTNSSALLTMGLQHGSFESTFIHQQESTAIRMGDSRKAQLATPEWNSAQLYSLENPLESYAKPATAHRLNVKTHVFKKELQEYVPTQVEDRLRIETIIYVELSIVSQTDGSLVKTFDYARLPKNLFFTQADKIMSEAEMATKNILDITATLQCPSNQWQEETEACLRCAKRMSAKLEQTESRILHLLPELHRTENGDSLISFRNGVANIQFKINCYCGHKQEKEGFVIRFDSHSDTSIASHVTLPLMFYHQNKNRIASRAAAAAVKAQAKAEALQQKLLLQQLKQQQKEQQRAASSPRNVVKSATSKSKREKIPKAGGSGGSGHSPLGTRPQHQFPTPPGSQLNSPVEYPPGHDLDDFMDNHSFNNHTNSVRSQSSPDSMASLFPELSDDSSSSSASSVAQIPQIQQQVHHQPQHHHQEPQVAAISHLTPSSGPTRGGTLVTIHGSGFTVGEMMYICFGQTFVPIIPQRDHMLECFTPASTKAETVAVFALHTSVPTTVIPAQATFTYVDDNEKELIKLALQRLMSISARLDGPLDSVVSRANEFTLWNDLLEDTHGSSTSSSSSTMSKPLSFSNLEKMVLESFKVVDDSSTASSTSTSTLSPISPIKNKEGLDIVNETGHTMLHLAVALQYETLVQDLILRGVDLKVLDKSGLSPLALAQRLGLKDMANLLSSAEHGTSTSMIWSKPLAHDNDHAATTSGSKLSTTLMAKHDDSHMDFEWEGYGASSSTAIKFGDNALSAKRNDLLPVRRVTDLQTSLHPSSTLQSDAHKSAPRSSSGILRSNILETGIMDVVVRGGDGGRMAASEVTLDIRDQHHHMNDDILNVRGDLQSVAEGVVVPSSGSLVNEAVARGNASRDEVVVVGRDCDNQVEGGNHVVGAVKQAGVQTGRPDDVSEPALLFLGGRPVVMTRHTRPAVSSTPVQEDAAKEDNADITHP